MAQEQCIFCNLGRQAPGPNLLYRDDVAFVVRDLHPRAPVHLLIIPLRHFTYLTSMTPASKFMVGHLFLVAQDMAKREGIRNRGYRLVINQGRNAGQEVAHIHLHLLGGGPLGAMG
ncbi:MAG: HIT domain-containing protein [Dehalococcoidia bacterium]|nr:HIT domain-containing protein [Dehalococcoidia bacterium]